MLNKGRARTSTSSSWIPSLAILSIGLILLLISGTIILALIPLYLKSKDVTPSNRNSVVLNALYATDLADEQSQTLSNTDDISAQISKTIFPVGTNLQTPSAQFLPATASNKKKRETSKNKITCEQATGLFGYILSTQHILQYPLMCRTPTCQQRYIKTMENKMKKSAQITVQMKFTNGAIRFVKLAFCSFSIPTIENSTLDTTTSFGDTHSVTTTPTNTGNTSKYIYLLDQDNNFLRFHPITYDVTFIGTINCSTTAYPYSMALQSTGKAWTLFTDGNLYTFDIQTVQCRNTSYVPEQDYVSLFGMHFARDELTNAEKLYISSETLNEPNHLATIDTDSLETSVIGYYRTVSARAELTATHDGKLFGLFEGEPYIIAEINQTTGEILSKTSQNAIEYQFDSSYFAFASYSSNFYLFVGNSSSTDVFLYDTSTKTTTKQTTILNGIIGAATLSNTLHI